MSVSLPPKLEALIREKVAFGAGAAKRDTLREMLREGVESGPSRETNIDSLIDELNPKFDQR